MQAFYSWALAMQMCTYKSVLGLELIYHLRCFVWYGWQKLVNGREFIKFKAQVGHAVQTEDFEKHFHTWYAAQTWQTYLY